MRTKRRGRRGGKRVYTSSLLGLGELVPNPIIESPPRGFSRSPCTIQCPQNFHQSMSRDRPRPQSPHSALARSVRRLPFFSSSRGRRRVRTRRFVRPSFPTDGEGRNSVQSYAIQRNVANNPSENLSPACGNGAGRGSAQQPHVRPFPQLPPHVAVHAGLLHAVVRGHPPRQLVGRDGLGVDGLPHPCRRAVHRIDIGEVGPPLGLRHNHVAAAYPPEAQAAAGLDGSGLGGGLPLRSFSVHFHVVVVCRRACAPGGLPRGDSPPPRCPCAQNFFPRQMQNAVSRTILASSQKERVRI